MSSAPLAHRLFFAVRPPSPLDVQIGNFAETEAGGGPRIRSEYLHTTLAISGDFATEPTHAMAGFMEAGHHIAAAPFDMTVDRLAGSRRSVALRPSRRSDELFALQRQIADVLRRIGLALRDGWGFSPHITLFYRDGVPFNRTVTGFCWRVEELVLIHSLVGRTEHHVLGRWPLRGRDDPQLSLF